MIGRRPRPVPSHSILYNLPPVPRLTRYQRRLCILSQREYILNHIQGNLGLSKYPFRIVISHWPHLIYEASLQDLLEPTKEVVIAFMYRTKNGNNVFRSRTLPRMNSLTASSNGWNFGGGGAPKVMHFCDCNH
jgi:hypothetical protein